ncbi:MAG: hypothetical protein RIE06_01805 [Roseibium album]
MNAISGCKKAARIYNRKKRAGEVNIHTADLTPGLRPKGQKDQLTFTSQVIEARTISQILIG